MPTEVPFAAFSSTASVAASIVDWDRDVEFVDVVDRDREGLVGERAVGRGRPHGDVEARAVGLAVDAVRNRHHAGGRIDREAAAGVVVSS